MKAKTYYMLDRKSPKGALRMMAPAEDPKWREPKHGGFDMPVKVIRVSDLDKVIERAAKALYVLDNGPRSAARWSKYPEGSQVTKAYRARARAAYRAGGLIP